MLMQGQTLTCGSRILTFDSPHIMGILNVTPDSFCATGRHFEPALAIAHAEKMLAEGATLIDVGGEPTSPQQQEFLLTEQQEIDRVVPIIEALKSLPVIISVDTSKARVMQAAVAAGATFINDVRGLRLPGARAMAASLNVPVCIMHMSHIHGLKQASPSEQIAGDGVTEVKNFLQQQRQQAITAGILPHNIVLDPGFGSGSFGKSTAQNLALMRHLEEFTQLGSPLLVGISRKAFIGEILKVAVAERLYGSIALAVMAALKGTAIIRVHDVKATVEALRMLQAVL